MIQKKITVVGVCANLEIRMLDDHHIQALSLKEVLLLPSQLFTGLKSKMAQRIRQ